MAVNPQLLGDGLPVPFSNEFFVLTRDKVDFDVDKLADAPGGRLSRRGTIYLSTIRLVFVANTSAGHIHAFDMPLLNIHEESFNQPIFFCNNLSGKVHPIIPESANRALYAPHSFKINFKEGGAGTFIPLFFNLLKSLRQEASSSPSAPPADPIPTTQPPVDEMIRHAYIDPNDPTRLYLQQPFESQPTLRRRNYTSTVAD
eukprot:TRINITY_DN2772_c0_g1_i1.p1 TRINITY_DN2772_c0_g1~~TRINITY_DN2772_c0_g1_i1.p1  ORF type:complete len:201 (+),score=26.39 TRINITY_DN2772_c0_g1_i1:121-723(+)